MTQNALRIGVLLLATTVLAAQGPAPAPTCRMCPATYVPDSELRAYLKRGVVNGMLDQQVRSVDVGKANVAIAMIHRGKLDKPLENSVAEHDQVSEVYYILDGAATLMTGPDFVAPQRRPAGSGSVRLNGPGNNAASVRNGVTHNLKAGDMIVIPAGTGHWYTKIDDHISYVMVRIDPDKVTDLKDEAASKADLARPLPARGGGGQQD